MHFALRVLSYSGTEGKIKEERGRQNKRGSKREKTRMKDKEE